MNDDRRRREYRDDEVLDVIATTGGVSPIWLDGNRTRLAALRRLGESGRIRALDDTSPEFKRFEVVEERPTLMERFLRWARGVNHE